ncbi:MAG: glycerol-3-phosphate 1-O-acyltransferase PlsY [Candidatus Arsenophonus melophagi]|nr:glycerol-3-phosphate 1-O-acyltransferase PlsY [Candidatus Arsenophonus melophagi]
MSAIAFGIIIFAYLCGSISSAVLIYQFMGLPDPRYHGSKNPGATNVLRIGNKKTAIVVLICDMLKGMIPLWLSYYLMISPLYFGIIAIATCLGHIYPIFFRFKGGKGVATAFGSIVTISLDVSSVIAGTWLLTFFLSGYSSLSAIVSAILTPFYVWWFKPEFTFSAAILSCLILFRHHGNIQKLWHGKESRIWKKRKKKAKTQYSNHSICLNFSKQPMKGNK